MQTQTRTEPPNVTRKFADSQTASAPKTGLKSQVIFAPPTPIVQEYHK